MAKVFLTFKGTTTGVVDAFYPTQALADAGASDSDIVAVQGDHTIPDDFRANKAYWDGTDVLPETPGTVIFAALSDTDKLKSAAQQLHDAYCQLVGILEAHSLADYFKRDHVNWAHDFLAYAHRGTRGVMMSTTYTTAQKLAWAAANGAGPSDVPPTNRAAFFEVVEDWTADDGSTRVPTAAVVFASPVDATRWTLANVVTRTAEETGLAEETDDVSEYIAGAWIANITA